MKNTRLQYKKQGRKEKVFTTRKMAMNIIKSNVSMGVIAPLALFLLNFYAMHLKTEQLYHDFINMSDEIAELMLMMGYMPIANLKECLQIAHIKELRSQYIDENFCEEEKPKFIIVIVG